MSEPKRNDDSIIEPKEELKLISITSFNNYNYDSEDGVSYNSKTMRCSHKEMFNSPSIDNLDTKLTNEINIYNEVISKKNKKTKTNDNSKVFKKKKVNNNTYNNCNNNSVKNNLKKKKIKQPSATTNNHLLPNNNTKVKEIKIDNTLKEKIVVKKHRRILSNTNDAKNLKNIVSLPNSPDKKQSLLIRLDSNNHIYQNIISQKYSKGSIKSIRSIEKNKKPIKKIKINKKENENNELLKLKEPNIPVKNEKNNYQNIYGNKNKSPVNSLHTTDKFTKANKINSVNIRPTTYNKVFCTKTQINNLRNIYKLLGNAVNNNFVINKITEEKILEYTKLISYIKDDINKP